MLPSKLSKNFNFPQAGFAPIWIILLIFLLGGIFIFGKGNLSNLLSNKQSSSLNKSASIATPSVVPSASSESTKVKPKSLYDLCQSEIQTFPKLPFTYEKITSTGSSAEQYRKDRIKDKKYLEGYAGCGLNYSIINVIEKAYASMGLQYYEYDKNNKSIRWASSDIKKFPVNIDNVYGEILKKDDWIRQTKIGGENLSYGLPTLIYYKDMGDKNYYIDVVVGPSSVSLELLIVKK